MAHTLSPSPSALSTPSLEQLNQSTHPSGNLPSSPTPTQNLNHPSILNHQTQPNTRETGKTLNHPSEILAPSQHEMPPCPSKYATETINLSSPNPPQSKKKTYSQILQGNLLPMPKKNLDPTMEVYTDKHPRIHCSTLSSERGGNPKIHFPQSTLLQITRRWERALIIRIFGKNLDTAVLTRRLYILWRIKGQMDIKDLGYRFMVIYNLNEDDRTRIKAGRPRRLGMQPVATRTWKPNFSVISELKKLITTLWLTIHHLPIEYRVPEILIHIGNSIGTTVALDGRNIYQAARSRIYVEIDLSTTPPATVEVNQRQYQVTLENSHFFSEILLHYFGSVLSLHDRFQMVI